MVAYLLLGETDVGRRRRERERVILAHLPSVDHTFSKTLPDIPESRMALSRLARSINGFEPVGGNRAALMADSNASIDHIAADMDAATDHIHLSFYIWLTDNNGTKIVEALKRAAGRGVKCRALVDRLGSSALIKSPQWRHMQEAGIETGVALGLGSLLVPASLGRVDLRNHRKSVIIDNRVCYFGSQNCADPEFRVKPKYAPWVDIFIRVEGPIARQSQYLFACDWMLACDDDLSSYLTQPIPTNEGGAALQAFGTGPTIRASAMSEMFAAAIFSANRQVTITTPYFVPDEALVSALCSGARRGVDVTVIFPQRNDSFEVAAASRSYYADLLTAGVNVHEYCHGLLHAKTITVDDDLVLIGSANMDRRSLELNYENNVLCYDPELAQAVRVRQQEFLAHAVPVTLEQVAAWSLPRRLWNNVMVMLGPVL